MNLRDELDARIAGALAACGAPDHPALVVAASKPEFGDYQANGAMAAAKALRKSPRDLAQALLDVLDKGDVIASAEIAGPGFINLRLSEEFIARSAAANLAAPCTASTLQTIVVDLSAPNLAKEMHVGHLRSTIIGDALARVFEHLGHRVVRQNHVGDWGTQFGMLITHLDEVGEHSAELKDLEAFYVAARQRFDNDPAFADRARSAVVALQSGDPRPRAAWQKFVDISMAHCEAVYDRLGAKLTRADVMAESAYNDDLADIVETIRKANMLTESNGAQCVFLEEFKAKDGSTLPVIIQKTDGGYLYATTDLAAVRYRAQTLHANRAIYVVGNPQSLHFKQIFAVARAIAGFIPADIVLEHCGFGSMLGRDGKPFKTRDGGSIKLIALIDEAERRASALIAAKSPDMPAEQRATIARAVSIGALKYADLSRSRSSDYIFDWDQMMSFEGNTAPYLQYAYTRILSIFRRADSTPAAHIGTAISLTDPLERTLALKLLRFRETIDAVAKECMPHYLCTYLYELAGTFMQFYEGCPVLNADNATRDSRLTLCAQSAAVLQRGLDLLGIATVERM